MSKPPPRPGKEINVLSLGAGVQSSVMGLMAACGEITPMPENVQASRIYILAQFH
jgi:hypothetical protein